VAALNEDGALKGRRYGDGKSRSPHPPTCGGQGRERVRSRRASGMQTTQMTARGREWVAGGFAGNQKKGQAKPNAHHLLRVCYETRSGVHKWCGPNSGSLHLAVTADKLWVLTPSA
jgi:hypothetical protein